MEKFTLVLVLLLGIAATSSGQDIVGQTIPRNVPPVKLFDELNYDLPGLAEVKAAVDRGDEAAAKAALLAYYRTKPDAQTRATLNADYDTHIPDELLKGRFIWGSALLYYGPKVEDIEWYKVPMDIHWPQFDHEIGRGTYITLLAHAYRQTGDDKYVAHLVALMLEFIKDCPVEDGRAMRRINNMDGLGVKDIGREALATEGHPAMMWTLMAAMRRVQLFPRIWQYCIHSPEMTPDALATILTSLIEHERYILDAARVVKFGNHGTRTATTALEIAAKCPEFGEREEWADRATVDVLNWYNWRDTNPVGFIYRDGATDEISPEVGRGDYGTLLAAMRWIELLGRDIPEQLLEIQEKMIEYYAYISWPSELPLRASRGRKGPGFDHRPDLDYIESGGRSGTVPGHTSYPMLSGEPCYAGTYFMRSDWTPEAVALRVRFGPMQYKYSMCGLGDVGDIGVWAYGKHLIPQIYQHPTDGEFRAYGDRSFAGDGRSENTISVDGVGQGRYGRERRIDEPLDNSWVTTPVFDYVRGSYKFDPAQVDVTHTRAVLFLKPDYFVVIDRVTGDGSQHTYRMKYQLHEDLSVRALGTMAVARSDGAPLLAVVPSGQDMRLDVIKGQKDPYYEGWHLNTATTAVPAPALIYEWEQPTPMRVETVICPVRRGQSADLEVARQVAGGLITLTVKRGDITDIVTIAEDDALTLQRVIGDTLTGAGMVQSTGMTTDLITMTAGDPGSAWVQRNDDGSYTAASNCSAAVVVPGQHVEEQGWDGR